MNSSEWSGFNMCVGNLTTLEFENSTEVNFTPADMLWIENHRVDKYKNETDKLHIYAVGLSIVVGEDISQELIERLKKYNFKRHFTVSTITNVQKSTD